MRNKFKNKFANFAILFNKAAEKGILLVVACVAAIIISNTSFSGYYFTFLNYPFIENKLLNIHLTVLDFINDFLMVVFFFLVGMEIKREMIEGHLATKKQRILPISAACCGVIVPVAVFSLLNFNNSFAMRAWAVPAATDIAFALGMLALFGRGLPLSLRIFLTALAIIDDLIAVIIIAIFYSNTILPLYLFMILLCGIILYLLNKCGFDRMLIYIFIGLILWYSFLRSGIHATVAGVMLAYFIPIRSTNDKVSLLRKLEHAISPYVLYIILPLFAFANSGVVFDHSVLSSGYKSLITLGIVLGLFLGKQIGIFSIAYILIKKGIASMPSGANFRQLYGVSILCGIGFTMSLFVGALAYKDQQLYLNQIKFGVLCGSLLSSIFGALVLKIIAVRRTR